MGPGGCAPCRRVPRRGGRAQEIILNRDTSLLAEYLPHVLAMHTDKFGAVRRAIVKIAEQTAKRHDACACDLRVSARRAHSPCKSRR